MTMPDRLARIPAWMLFVVFAIGLIIIYLGARPIAHLIEPLVATRLPAKPPVSAIPSMPDSVELEALESARISLDAAQAQLIRLKGSPDKKAIAEAQKQYDAAVQKYQAQLLKVERVQLASSVGQGPASSAGTSTPESSFALAEEYVTLGMKVLLTLALGGASIFVVLSQRFTPQAKHWGYGMLGTLLGFWLKV